MFYLILAIMSSVLISVCMRASEKHIVNQMEMFTANYAICSVLSMVYMEWKSVGSVEMDFTVIFLMGAISGILYLANFIFLKYNMQKNGIVLSSTFMKLGVLIPTIMAVVVFGESPKVSQVIGIVIAIVAFVLAVRNKKGLNIKDCGYGLLIGIPNYYSARFLLMALRSMDAVLVYPLYSVATIILITVTGVLVFKEKLSVQKTVALLLVMVAISLINM